MFDLVFARLYLSQLSAAFLSLTWARCLACLTLFVLLNISLTSGQHSNHSLITMSWLISHLVKQQSYQTGKVMASLVAVTDYIQETAGNSYWLWPPGSHLHVPRRDIIMLMCPTIWHSSQTVGQVGLTGNRRDCVVVVRYYQIGLWAYSRPGEGGGRWKLLSFYKQQVWLLVRSGNVLQFFFHFHWQHWL